MKKSIRLALVLCPLYLFCTSGAFAESLFVTNHIKIGLHEEKDPGSVIVKLVDSGTELEVIKRDDKMSFVREPGGATGWIDNSYLSGEPPLAEEQLQALRKRGDVLEQRLVEARQKLKGLESGAVATGAAAKGGKVLQELRETHKQTLQDLKTERLKSGELQIKLSELRKRVGQDNDSDSLYDQITSLQEKNKKLRITLAALRETTASTQSGAESGGRNGLLSPGGRTWMGSLILALFIGIAAGIYFMDFLNRRRHGGFRV